MASSNKRPKYPNRDRVIFHRYISQAVFLLFGVGLALFYLAFNDGGGERETGDALDELATSITQNADTAGRPLPPGSAPGSFPPSPSASGPPAAAPGFGDAARPSEEPPAPQSRRDAANGPDPTAAAGGAPERPSPEPHP